MIKIKKSETADTRTCDWSKVDQKTLLRSSEQHRGDIIEGIRFFRNLMLVSSMNHDFDKITDIDSFHKDFATGFKSTEWWDRHRKKNRHHLNHKDGIPDDVNLVDVLEYVTDCVMAGMARAGEVYDPEISLDVLEQAFKNTVKLLKEQIVVEE
jgi:hypothetical protein